MSVVAFYEIDADRGGKIDDNLLREYDRTYIAVCNSKRDRELEILLHPFCPKPRLTLSDWDGVARCKSVDFKFRPRSRWRWTVKASFSTQQTEPAKSNNPTDDDADIDITTQLVSKERFTDRNGMPYVNRAGDIIKVSRRIPQLTINISKNISIYSGWVQKIGGVINANPVRIKGELYDAFTLMVTGVRIGKTEWRNDFPYMVCQLELSFDPDGWVQAVLNQGFNERVPDPTKPKKNGRYQTKRARCRDEFGQPETNPVFLNEEGRRPRERYFDAGGVEKLRLKETLDPQDIVILKLDQMDLLDFESLPIK